MKPNSTIYKAALYMRLSKDDYNQGESSSIINQRKMLVSFAKKNCFNVVDEYIDDGWSGTNFDRPSFKRMIQDIEDKKVNLVITKDLSRLGRDYITTGQYTEIYFPSKKVRYIAINDGYDSNSKYADIVPFKNIINEMYARDTSQKIRSSFQTKMSEGDFIGNFAPYGYIKDPNNKNHLLINTEVSEIIKKIFSLAVDGCKPKEIAEYLNNRNIQTPAQYRCSKYPHLNVNNYTRRKEWTSSAVSKILKNIVYLGHTAQGKTTKVSFKSNIIVQNSKSEWIIVKNTHEPIISEDVFNEVKRRSLSRTCEKKSGFTNIFSGLAKCMDCGRNMSSVGTRKKGSASNLACGGYKLYGKKECNNHFIDYNVLYDIVLKAIRKQVVLSRQDQATLLEDIRSKIDSDESDAFLTQELKKAKNRSKELDGIIERLYEDNFKGVINDIRFKKFIEKYEKESDSLNKEINELEHQLTNKKRFLDDVINSYEKFYELIKEYTEIKELNQDILFQFIDHIEIGQGYYEKTPNGKVKHQKIKIFFKFLGKASVNLHEV